MSDFEYNDLISLSNKRKLDSLLNNAIDFYIMSDYYFGMPSRYIFIDYLSNDGKPHTIKYLLKKGRTYFKYDDSLNTELKNKLRAIMKIDDTDWVYKSIIEKANFA